MQKNNNILNTVFRYYRGESTSDELEKAISLFEDPYHNLKLRPTLFELWNSDEKGDPKQPEMENLYEVLNQIHHKINLDRSDFVPKERKKLVIKVLSIAAVLLVGLILGFYINSIQNNEPVYYTSVAPKGSISQILLPDNTLVYLNSGSEIKYSIDGVKGQRELFLKGEGWFQVKKNEKKPFIVHTQYYDVRVLGTEFNVKAYPEDDEISTTLEKGIVKITSTEKFKIQSNQVLKPGEQLVYNKAQNTVELKEVNTRLYTSWKENKLIFINMSLSELIVLLERKYGVDIDVINPAILNYHYDGTIKDETILEVLDILKETLPIQYKIIDQKIQIIDNINSN